MADQQQTSTLSVTTVAERLRRAEHDRVPIAPFAGSAMSLDEAYEVQRLNLATRYADGEAVAGRKVGLTSEVMQRQLGVDRPDFGVITDRMVVPDGAVLDPTELIAPRAEAEFAFVFGRDLGVGPSIETIRSAVSHVAVSIEVIDSRVADWRISLADTVADNASSARIVVGPLRESTDALLDSLPATEITISLDGTRRASGPGSAVLGDPLVALHWLASTLAEYGESISAGEIVLAGSVHAALPLERGRWEAQADGFGPVRLLVGNVSAEA